MTRVALEQTCPLLLYRWNGWWRRDGISRDHQWSSDLHIGNLWSRNFLAPGFLLDPDDESESCPHRGNVISLNRPFRGFGDLQRPALESGRLMMAYPLTEKEKHEQRQWRWQEAQRVRTGVAHQISLDVMIVHRAE